MYGNGIMYPHVDHTQAQAEYYSPQYPPRAYLVSLFHCNDIHPSLLFAPSVHVGSGHAFLFKQIIGKAFHCRPADTYSSLLITCSTLSPDSHICLTVKKIVQLPRAAGPVFSNSEGTVMHVSRETGPLWFVRH